MTVPRTLPHVDAVRTALEAAALTVFLGVAPPDSARPYVALHVDPGSPEPSSLTGEHDQAAIVVQTTCVADTVEQALWLADRVLGALLDRVLEVDGRAGWRPEVYSSGPPVQRDDDVTPNLFYLTPQFTVRSSAV